ncbi:phage head-tail connector protein [Amycolatopsis thermoflava]|uniref:phage head-tail connector protein n=1 Tax=Amycolatopsis thermoflava TaxID=84480 RepID=UPI00364C63A1
MTWPPSLDELKSDRKIPLDDHRDDEALQRDLDTAVDYVEDVRPEFNYTGDALSDAPAPTARIRQGTIRLAGRWYDRRNSPNGLVDMGELGANRIPSVDPDIERMLGIGRYRGMVFA